MKILKLFLILLASIALVSCSLDPESWVETEPGKTTDEVTAMFERLDGVESDVNYDVDSQLFEMKLFVDPEFTLVDATSLIKHSIENIWSIRDMEISSVKLKIRGGFDRDINLFDIVYKVFGSTAVTNVSIDKYFNEMLVEANSLALQDAFGKPGHSRAKLFDSYLSKASMAQFLPTAIKSVHVDVDSKTVDVQVVKSHSEESNYTGGFRVAVLENGVELFPPAAVEDGSASFEIESFSADSSYAIRIYSDAQEGWHTGTVDYAFDV